MTETGSARMFETAWKRTASEGLTYRYREKQPLDFSVLRLLTLPESS